MSVGTRHDEQTTHAVTSREELDEAEQAFEIAAAQLRVVTDRRLGKVTPEWVKELAAEDSHPHDSDPER